MILATYFGSPGFDSCQGRPLQDGTLLFTGSTSSTEFPLVNPIQSASNPGPFRTGYLAKIDHSVTKLLYSTYIGGEIFSGNPFSLAVDQDENIYIFGRAFNQFLTLKDPYQSTYFGDSQGFLMKLDPSGRNLIFSTYTPAYGTMAVDQARDIYLGGYLILPDAFPLKNPFPTQFNGTGYLMKFAASGKSVIFSTLMPSVGSPVLDSAGGLYFIGTTSRGQPSRPERFSAQARGRR